MLCVCRVFVVCVSCVCGVLFVFGVRLSWFVCVLVVWCASVCFVVWFLCLWFVVCWCGAVLLCVYWMGCFEMDLVLVGCG